MNPRLVGLFGDDRFPAQVPYFEQTRKWAKSEDAKKKELAMMHEIADDFLDERSVCGTVLSELADV